MVIDARLRLAVPGITLGTALAAAAIWQLWWVSGVLVAVGLFQLLVLGFLRASSPEAREVEEADANLGRAILSSTLWIGATAVIVGIAKGASIEVFLVIVGLTGVVGPVIAIGQHIAAQIGQPRAEDQKSM